MDWTDDAIARLRVLWAEGHSVTAIARHMGCTRGCITGKVRRLDMPPRPSPIIRPVVPEAPVKVARAEVVRPAYRPKLTLAPLPDAEVKPEPVVVRRMAYAPCCWPLGEPRTPGFRYCDADAVPGRSYCPEHAELAYRAPTQAEKRLAA